MTRKERGQALLEGVLALGVLTALMMAVGVIGRYGDVRIRAEHALQYHLFDQARLPEQELLAKGAVEKGVTVLAPWRDTRGVLWLPEGKGALHLKTRSGEQQIMSYALADDWQRSLHDESMMRLDLTQSMSFALGLRLGVVEHLPDIVLQRSLYRGTGYAVDEAQVSARLAASEPLWQRLQRRHAPHLAWAQRLRGLDAAWGRPAPGGDWLRPIEKQVPEDRLLKVVK